MAPVIDRLPFRVGRTCPNCGTKDWFWRYRDTTIRDWTEGTYFRGKHFYEFRHEHLPCMYTWTEVFETNRYDPAGN